MKLVGASKENIILSVNELLEDEILYAKMSRSHNPYGDGRACERIVEFVWKILNA